MRQRKMGVPGRKMACKVKLCIPLLRGSESVERCTSTNLGLNTREKQTGTGKLTLWGALSQRDSLKGRKVGFRGLLIGRYLAEGRWWPSPRGGRKAPAMARILVLSCPVTYPATP